MPKAKRLPSGSYRCRVYDGTRDGKQIYKSFTAQTKKEAERLAAVYAASRHISTDNDYTVKEAMERFLTVNRDTLSGSTYTAYRAMYRNDFKGIQQIKIAKLTQENVTVWLTDFSRTHSPKSCHNAHGFLSVVLRQYAPDLVLHTKLPEVPPKNYNILTEEQLKAFLESIRGTVLERAVVLAAFGSCRRSEICALMDTDIENGRIHVQRAYVADPDGGFYLKDTPKTKASNRWIDLPDFAMRLFDGIEGRLVPYSPNWLNTLLQKKEREAGIENPCTLHELRHYFATFLHSMNVPDQYIQKAGGWSTDNTLKKIYRNTMTDYEAQFNAEKNDHLGRIFNGGT